MVEETVVVGEGTEFPLEGTLTVPDGPGAPFPAVVFVHGSGPSDRDETVGELKPFRDLAEGLARHGVASLRYDKRTFVHAKRMVRTGDTTVRVETIDDAVLAADLLRADPRIDSDRIFIIGHSMGAMLAPRIDAEGGDFAGMVLMAGSPRRMEQVIIDQGQDALDSMRGLMRWLANRQIGKVRAILEAVDLMDEEEARRTRFGGGTYMYYFKEMAAHPSEEYLLCTEKPILIMQGSADFQTHPEREFDAYRRLLGDRPNVTYRLYEGLNHAFVPAIHTDITKAKQEYSVERHIGEDVISDIAGWVLAAGRDG